MQQTQAPHHSHVLRVHGRRLVECPANQAVNLRLHRRRLLGMLGRGYTTPRPRKSKSVLTPEIGRRCVNDERLTRVKPGHSTQCMYAEIVGKGSHLSMVQ